VLWVRYSSYSAFAKNEVGMLLEDLICQGKVDTSLIKWADTDGIGRVCRNGLLLYETSVHQAFQKYIQNQNLPKLPWKLQYSHDPSILTAKYVDVMIGNEEDFTACLGFDVDGNDNELKKLNLEGYERMI